MSITPISLVGIGAITPARAVSAPVSTSFENILGQAIQSLGTSQAAADAQAKDLASGKNVNLVDAMVTMQQTSLDFQLAMQTRDKVLEAYQSIMQTQV
jgi:flagellar hook-basal body complex protein FliE